jgi:hypothetical protein
MYARRAFAGPGIDLDVSVPLDPLDLQIRYA